MVVIRPILVVTSTPGFGELIQQSLEETGEYRAFLVDSTKEALALANARPFSLAILDTDLENGDFPTLVRALKDIQDSLSLIVIPPENNPEHPLLSQIPFDGFLAKPFYLPDLLDTVAEAIRANPNRGPSIPAAGKLETAVNAALVSEPKLEWLKDVNRAAQHLTRLSLESSALAALIVHQAELWAYAGQLSQPAAGELAAVVARFWVDSRPPESAASSRAVDMMRVVHLNATHTDYILYATSLGREMVLALAFEAATPLSTIRSQVNTLVRSLASPEQSLPPPAPPRLVGQPQAPQPVTPAQKRILPIFLPPQESEEEDLFDEEEGELPPIDLTPLLEDVPPPDPKNLAPFLGAPRQATPAAGEAMPQPLAPSAEVVEEVLHPISPALHGLYYACVMIPRLPQHHLTGDLASALAEMVGQLNISYGWRLEHIAIRPEYLHWIASVPPSTSPSYLMRIIRQQTSDRIFAAFPALRSENPSGDFWAPGYLIMSGAQQPPVNIIRDFIQRTRQYQGAEPRSRQRV